MLDRVLGQPLHRSRAIGGLRVHIKGAGAS
jgi:hypothetical protein